MVDVNHRSARIQMSRVRPIRTSIFTRLLRGCATPTPRTDSVQGRLANGEGMKSGQLITRLLKTISKTTQRTFVLVI